MKKLHPLCWGHLLMAPTFLLPLASCAAQTSTAATPETTRLAQAAPDKKDQKKQAPASKIQLDPNAPFPGIPLAPVPDELLNKWPAAEEAAFQARAREMLAHFAEKIKPGNYGGTFFENEKKSYPYAMLDFLNGHPDAAIKFLQSNDADAKTWNTVTDGIDFYPAFTLKGQGRKYFLFGAYLDADYKARMFNAAKTWTQQDPLRRPHPYYKKGGDGWTPETKNSWVDVRGTDNLRVMREANAYIFAEETGNEETRQIYKKRIASYAARLYSTGLGEWDSENYFGHTTAAFLNLYDFAKDQEVRAQAKASLDWLMIAAALKYRHGGWAAPTKRDYGGASRVYGSLSARFFHIYFGDAALPNPDPEPDVIHAITSRYRPPLTALAIARKEFEPVEMLEAKPDYSKWSAQEPPQFWETMFYGKTFQMGSVVSREPANDASPFKMGADNTKNGVDFFFANTLPVIGHQGKNKGDQIAQNRNLLIWLRPADGKTFEFLAPKGGFQAEDGIWFWKLEQTWLALRPINLGAPKFSDITKEVKKKKEPTQVVPNENYADAQVLGASSMGDSYVGFALEVGEGGDYESWKRAVKEKGVLDLNLLNQGVAKLTGSGGQALRVQFNKTDDLPVVHRDGVERKWAQETAVYAPQKGALVSQEWGGGTLRAQAGGHIFEASVSSEGEVTWSEK